MEHLGLLRNYANNIYAKSKGRKKGEDHKNETGNNFWKNNWMRRVPLIEDDGGKAVTAMDTAE